MRTPIATALLALSFGSLSPVLADTGTASASSSAVLESPTKAKRLTDPPPLAVVGVLEDGLSGSCTLSASNNGAARKGVKGTFEAVLIDGDTGNTIANLGRKSGRTGRNGELTVSFPVASIQGPGIQAAMLVEMGFAGGKKLSEYEFACSLVDETP